MLSINNISIHFGGRYLFENISFTANKMDRIGLIGRNGTGKSTLLKIIGGERTPEEGNFIKPNDYIIGYLPQDLENDSQMPIFEECEHAMSDLKAMEIRIEEIANELGIRDDYESKEYLDLVDELSHLNERYYIHGGQSAEAEIERVLTGLGFNRSELYKPYHEFSGGWQMRVELAKLLLSDPDCLLLDEPTNHLDIESIGWLENYLSNYSGTALIVSHDRKFLDKVTNRTIEIANRKIYDLKLKYSEFIIARELQKEHEMNAFKNQKKEIQQIERFVERFKAKASLASRAQSRVKKLEKIERIEMEVEDHSKIKFSFPEPPKSGRLVAECISLSKSFGQNHVLKKIDFEIESGEKVAFVGRNGEGKSTLSRILANIEDYEGVFKLGHNVTVGYYAQHQAELLDGDRTVLEIIDGAAKGDIRTKIRDLLGAFLFSGDSVYKKVKVLSGGEKSRLALCKLLLEPVNFLILDEPTNHLDMVAKDVLKEALLKFSGSVLIVSHDRDFLDGLTNKTYYFKNHKIKAYIGGIYEFLRDANIESIQEIERKEKISEKILTVNNESNQETNKNNKQERQEKKSLQKEQNRIKKLIESAEKEIAELEEKINTLEVIFSEPDFYQRKDYSELQNEYSSLQMEIAMKMEEWTKLGDEYDEFQ